ncbi:unnamed protein product [Ostreobium quekettii]|uniref:VLRF1 domain-containing protein n=1 Tax=Ostreobium quekettii TaxID=121088 RepID=A0A8S1IMZ0_9CHLO|nr:unnamed protein product [Ostreobium quekettii]
MGYSPGRSENCEIVLPRVLDQPTSNSMSCRKFTDQLEQEGIGCQLVVLLSAESAALGLWEDGSLKEHKVLRGYTVRKQQGKAQATYERRGGGAGSAGGSLRSRETRRLFQSVASRLAEWGPRVAACNRLFASGGVRSWNELYASRSPAPGVDRRDARWRRVGVAVRRPKFADLDRVYRVLSEGTLCTYRDADFGAQTPGHVSDAGS